MAYFTGLFAILAQPYPHRKQVFKVMSRVIEIINIVGIYTLLHIILAVRVNMLIFVGVVSLNLGQSN